MRRAAYELLKKRIWTRPAGDTRLPHVSREAAEYPNSFILLGPGVEHVETPRFTLCMERIASSNTVQRQRFAADQLDEVLSEVRSLLRLFGGATLPDARGRGAYRALIRARWEYARASRAPALLTQAGAMSRPILERLGFRRIGHIHMLEDDFGQAST